MSHIQADRVKETSTTTGTGDLTLGGAVSKFKTFASRMANGDTTYYGIEHQSADEWEVGFGTWTTGGIFQRTLVLQSSNADAAVNLSAGTKHVYVTLPSIAAGFGTLTTTPSTDQNDYAPTGFNLASRLNINAGASMKLTGLAGGHATRQIAVVNASTDFLVWLEHENPASTAANRFTLPQSFPMFLFPGEWATFVYLGSRWVYSGGNQVGQMGLETFEDFVTPPGTGANNGAFGRYAAFASGTGASVVASSNNINTTNKPLGQMSFDKGTTTTGRAGLGSGGAGLGVGAILPALGPAFHIARLRIITPADGTDTYTVWAGFNDVAGSGAAGRVVAWEYRWTGSAVEWSQTRIVGGVTTRSNTGSPTPGTSFIWVAVFLNPGWTRADFIYSTDSVNFVKADAVTTGLPSGANPVAPGVAAVGTAGTAARPVILDLLGHRAHYVRS